jgi:hypothetical protein
VRIRESDTGKTHKIEQKECGTAHKTLGVWKALDGNQKSQKAALEKKSAELTRKQSSAYLTRQETYLAHEVVYMSAIAYPLATTYFPKSTLDHIHSKALQVYTPGMGYNIRFPRAVLHAPNSIGGPGVRTIIGEQGATAAKLVIQHIRCKTTLNVALRLHLGWVQTVAGTGLPILEDTRPIPHLEGRWIKALRDYLRTVKAHITIQDLWMPKLLRENDSYIMNTAMKYTMICRELKDINRCRLYLQVITVSELADPRGETLMPHSIGKFYRTDARRITTSKLNWPTQPKPGHRSWETWRRFLRMKVVKSMTTLVLREKLGKWYDCCNDRTRWQNYVEPTTATLYTSTTNQTWNSHKPVYRRAHFTTIYKTKPTHKTVTVPNEVVPAHLYKQGQVWRGEYSKFIPKVVTAPATSWAEHKDQLPQWTSSLLSNVTELTQWHSHNIKLKSIGVSDGGKKDGVGSFGWIFEIDDNKVAKANGLVGGDPATISSFRTEAYGLLSMLSYVEQYIEYHRNPPAKKLTFLFYSDNLGLIRRTAAFNTQQMEPKHTTAPDYDLIVQIHHVRGQLEAHNIETEISHVIGHQDDHTPFEKLSKEAQLNVHANNLASEALTWGIPEETSEIFDEMPAASCQLYINEVPVLGNVVRPLRDALHIKEYKKYMHTNLRWTVQMYDEVDWIQTGRAMKAFDYNDQVRLHKIRHNWLPTNKLRNRWSSHIPNECPLCHSPEPQRHVYQCTHPTRQGNVNKELVQLISGLRDGGTDSQLCDIINKAIQGWLRNNKTRYDVPLCLAASTTRAIESQNQIGWNNFLAGFLSKRWQKAIQETNNKTDEKNNETAWYNNTFRLVCNFSIRVWLSRNYDIYGDTKATVASQQKTEYMDEITQLYERAQILPMKYRHFTAKPIGEWKNSTATEMYAWLVQARPIVQQVEKTRSTPQNEPEEIQKYTKKTVALTVGHNTTKNLTQTGSRYDTPASVISHPR